MIGVCLARVLEAGAMLGGLAGAGGGVLIVVVVLLAALASLLPLCRLPVDDTVDGPEADPRQLLSSL